MTSTLDYLVEQDFGLTTSGQRWAKGDVHDSLVIDNERGIFYWNSQSIRGGPLTYLMKVRGMPYPEAITYLKNLDKEFSPFTQIDKDTPQDIISYPLLVTAFWENGKDNRDYWYHRCLTDSTIDRFRLGFYQDWYALPIFFNGIFRNFQMRRDKPEKRIRPWYRGVGPLPINLDILKLADKIYMAEGPVDAILLNQIGFPAISHSGGAQGFSPDWFKYFISTKEIIYIADNDKAGREGAKKIAKILGEYRVRIYDFKGFPESYDTVAFFRDGGKVKEFKELLDNNLKYSFQLEARDE